MLGKFGTGAKRMSNAVKLTASLTGALSIAALLCGCSHSAPDPAAQSQEGQSPSSPRVETASQIGAPQTGTAMAGGAVSSQQRTVNHTTRRHSD
jgi:hypothetical protein